jgi:glycosyltransferase involved in cell wall biosynthesis
MDDLQALARRLGVIQRVQFIGAVAHAQVPEQLHGFDIFAAASRLDSESFGVSVIEASACGLPVVVTRAGGLPEVVREGETGLVVERGIHGPGKALRLIDDPTLRARLGAAGRAHVQARYEWDSCVQTMIEVYRQALRASTEGRLPAGQVR